MLSRFIIYGLKIIASTFADISLLLVDRTVFPKVRAVAASVQHLRNTHFPDLVMLTLQQLCEAVKKNGEWLEAGEANPRWPILAGTV